MTSSDKLAKQLGASSISREGSEENQLILKLRQRQIEEHLVQRVVFRDVQAEVGIILELRDLCARHIAHEVDFACEQRVDLCLLVGDDAEDNPVKARTATEIIFVCFERDALGGVPLNDLERASANRLPVEWAFAQVLSFEDMGRVAGAVRRRVRW